MSICVFRVADGKPRNGAISHQLDSREISSEPTLSSESRIPSRELLLGNADPKGVIRRFLKGKLR